MSNATRWRLSKRLLWGFTLLAALPILVVGLATRYYTRSLLDRSLDQRVELTRRLVSNFSRELESRATDAARMALASKVITTHLADAGFDRAILRRTLDSLTRETRVGGMDIDMVQPSGVWLVARSDHPMHFGFPVQAPEAAPTITTWPAPELSAYCYGITVPLADSRYTIVVYFPITSELLAPLAEAGGFLIGSNTIDDEPLIAGEGAVSQWPEWYGVPNELVQVAANQHIYALGRVGPFYYGIPLDDNLAALRRLDLFLLLATLLAIGVAVLAARRVAYSAARPVEELADTVSQWGRGGEAEPLITFAEGEAATLVDAFEHLRGELSAAERRLADSARAVGWQEMARKVAHEIKNPLTPIRVTMEDLARRMEKDPDGALKMIPEATRLIAEEVEVLRRIVDAFARFARLPEPKPESVDLNDVVADTVKLNRPSAGPQVIFAPAPAPVRAMVDPQLLGEAFTNLIKNAVEAAGTAGTVQVTIGVANGSCTVEFEDTGKGYPDDLLKQGPRPYFTTKRGGTGLGLIISQRIVTDAGGELTLSNTATGAKAVVTLKVA